LCCFQDISLEQPASSRRAAILLASKRLASQVQEA
jgi:hypothetical protein